MQLILALEEHVRALLIGCRNLETQPIAVPKDIAVIIINSNVKLNIIPDANSVKRRRCRRDLVVALLLWHHNIWLKIFVRKLT